MDAYLSLVSMRAVHEYTSEPLKDEEVERILQAGRTSGSSRNTQPWRFFAIRSRAMLDKIADTVYAPYNLTRCTFAVAIATSRTGFDTGRCAERMMLAAWSDGIGSSPNGIKEPDALAQLLGLSGDEAVGMVISFGYPTKTWAPRDAGAILNRINRKPLDDLVVRID